MLTFLLLKRLTENRKLDGDFSCFSSPLQHNYLAQVTSNIWGTKFKIVGLAAFLPTNLGAGKPCILSSALLPVRTQTQFQGQWPKVENELI